MLVLELFDFLPLNIDTFYQYVSRGVILLAAVLFDRLKNRGND
jgi:ABC-type xylose transport system permease subunit